MVVSDTTGPDGEDKRPIGDNDGVSPDGGDDAARPTPFDTDEAATGEAKDSETAELELGGDDDRLPWLEGDGEFEEPGHNTAQLVMAGLLGLLALALIVGGIWWATRAGPDTELVADGGVIEAPDAPYKERPEDPGGKTFDGTGDTSFAVSDGQTRTVQLGDEKPDDKSPVKPGFDSVDDTADGTKAAAKPAAAPTPAPKPSPSPAATSAPASTGPGVQVAAYSSRATAEDGWNKLKQQYSDLSGMRYRIVEGQADIGKVYRVQALPGDKAAADALCRKLKAAGLNCHVKN